MSMMLEKYVSNQVKCRWSCDRMKCCTFEERFACGETINKYCHKKIMSDKDMSNSVHNEEIKLSA